MNTRFRGRLAWIAVAALTGTLACAAEAGAATDDWWDAGPLQLNWRGFFDNQGLTVVGADAADPDEPYTRFGTDECKDSKPFGAWMGATLWGTFTGTGGRVTVSTAGSSDGTMLTVYDAGNGDPSDANAVGCSDDIGAGWDGGLVSVESSAPGERFLVQVGSCDGYRQNAADPGTDCGPDLNAEYAITVLTNDQRAYADTGTGLRANIGASSDSAQTCHGTSYGDDVWFRYHATDYGWLTAHASGALLTVMAIYRGASTTHLTCSDNLGGSQLAGELEQYVRPGEDYYIQVGGRAVGAGSYDEDQFTYTTSFRKDFDVDGDHWPRPGDCNDNDAAINPGATEIPYNSVDEDCKNGPSYDKDGDGHDSDRFGGNDCNDDNPHINPGVAEHPGDDVDENCDGIAAPGSFRDPVVKAESAPFQGGRYLYSLQVQKLKRGMHLEVRCRGSRACPKRYSKTVRRSTVTLKKYKGKLFRRGTKIEVFVTTRGNILGYYQGIVIRGTRKPRRPICDITPRTAHRVVNCR